MLLTTPITELKGVGEQMAKKLAVLQIFTVRDLLEHYPRRYEDYSHITAIKDIVPGIVTIKAQVKQAAGRYVRRGMHITEAVASDDSSSVRLIWFNQPYRAAALKPGEDYYISGEFALRRQRLSILNPSVELVSSFPVNTARIVPIYRETKGLKSFQLRKLVRETLPLIESLDETLPTWLLASQKLESRASAMQTMHFPASAKHLQAAQKRLGFEEVFELTLAALLNKYELMQQQSLSIAFNEQLARDFVKHLTFKLTDDQRIVIWRIYQDMERTQPMDRLLEGDVGSGKTVVAAMAAVMAMHQGFQVALMAPTELLARQHAETLHELLKPLNMDEKVSLLVGSLSAAQKRSAHAKIKDGSLRFIIGTHALIQEKVGMQKLGLVIVDEQHRFGVEQRKKLQAKAGHMPHILSMTATPIPRTLALTLFGDLDISIIASKPPGRKEIITKLCSPNARIALYKEVDTYVEKGQQAFVVCPLITESNSMPMKSAEEVYEQLRTTVYKHRRVGLLHGKMKAPEKVAVMQQFIDHELDVLVATTVIEVGVNVPNANIMVIENAERFGLAQIHQLRGRVGRSTEQGRCYLLLSDSKAPSPRLRALERTTNGFELAELDLQIRGPGAIYGTMQHGELDLRVAKLTDVKLIASARASAQEFIDRQENLLQYDHLYVRVSKLRAVTNLN